MIAELLDRLHKPKLPEHSLWHAFEIGWPRTLIDGGFASYIAWRRWNGTTWEYAEHPEEDERWWDSQW